MSSVFANILVGWDGSEGAAEGLKLALRLTESEGGRVAALAAVPGYTHVEDATARARAIEEVKQPLRQSFDALLAARPLTEQQHVSLEFADGADPAKAFERYSRQHAVDLVIVGLHGQEGLLHARMGHIASHAVQISRCPVLVVPSSDAAGGGLGIESHDSLLSTLFHPFRHREAQQTSR